MHPPGREHIFYQYTYGGSVRTFINEKCTVLEKFVQEIMFDAHARFCGYRVCGGQKQFFKKMIANPFIIVLEEL